MSNYSTKTAAERLTSNNAPERRQRIIAHAFREYGTILRLFPPDIGSQMAMPPT